MQYGERDLATNKRARFDYELFDTIEAGIVLLGSEIKSLRLQGASLQEAYISAKGGELFLFDCHIAPYRFTTVDPHEERRPRKLLLHRHERDKLLRQTSEKGMALVPLKIYLKKGKAKVLLATAKGRRKGDKREAIQERDQKRDVARAMRRDQE